MHALCKDHSDVLVGRLSDAITKQSSSGQLLRSRNVLEESSLKSPRLLLPMASGLVSVLRSRWKLLVTQRD